MFETETTIVLGAGSSFDLGFPLGWKLKENISRELERVSSRYPQPIHIDRIRETFRSLLGRRNPEKEIALANALRRFGSIDDCLGSFHEDEEIVKMGKWMIAYSIAKAEQESKISKILDGTIEEKRQAKIDILDGTWVNHLIKMLITGIPRSRCAEVFSRITIINFNYDRAIYACLKEGLQDAYALSDGTVCDLMRSLSCFHPYGNLGEYSFEEAIPMGNCWAPRHDLISGAAQNLQVYTETTVASDDLMPPALKERLVNSRKILFLGFGFHKQNMALLNVRGMPNQLGGIEQQVFATLHGVPAPQRVAFQNRIQESFYTNTSNKNLVWMGSASDGCDTLLKDHAPLLTDNI